MSKVNWVKVADKLSEYFLWALMIAGVSLTIFILFVPKVRY